MRCSDLLALTFSCHWLRLVKASSFSRDAGLARLVKTRTTCKEDAVAVSGVECGPAAAGAGVAGPNAVVVRV